MFIEEVGVVLGHDRLSWCGGVTTKLDTYFRYCKPLYRFKRLYKIRYGDDSKSDPRVKQFSSLTSTSSNERARLEFTLGSE